MFKNKVVIITGAAGSVGQTAANSFYLQGANLVLVDINVNDIIKASEKYNFDSDRVVNVSADVSSEDQVKKYVKEAINKFGKIDVF